jgi:hypothetical protein
MTGSGKPGPTDAVFFQGDEVVLARGTYTGTPGVFLRSRADIKWANITERDGTVRSHPLEWLAHAAVASPIHLSPIHQRPTAIRPWDDNVEQR